jgi:hypothetical protein
MKYRMYHLKSNPKINAYYGINMKSEADCPLSIDCTGLRCNTRVKITPTARPLLKLVAQKLCGCKLGVFMKRTHVYLEHYFESKSFGTVLDEFINAYRRRVVQNKTKIHRPVT